MELAHGQVHRKRGAILATACDFPAFADDLRFAGADVIREVRFVLAAIGLRHQPPDVLADDLLGGVGEEPLRGRVERLQHPLVVDRDDAVESIVDDGSDAAAVVDPWGDLEAVELHQLERCPGGRGGLAVGEDFDHRLPLAAFQLGIHVRHPALEHRLAGLLVRDVEHGFEGLVERLGVRPAGQRLGDAVQAGDMTAGVGRDHRIADAGERDP